ncbi:hypothetical protein [Lysinibacillus fusiformis]|uniref:PglD-related sugar-binding protein n=1 Tax=Lysinibacillus fusiformis TaxID=28031 RepID=UPI003AAB3FEF
MNLAIYGAGLSGYYAKKLLELQGHKIEFFIDEKPQEAFKENANLPIVLKKDIQLNVKNKIDCICVALGNKQVAFEVKKGLAEIFNGDIITVHEEPYKELFEQLKLFRENEYLKQVGYYHSLVINASVDYEGNPIPWISYPLFFFIKERIQSDFKVFEWGSGNSTLWWEKHVNKVIAVENDKGWFHKVKNAFTKEQTEILFIQLEYGGAYSKSIRKYNDIDIAIVDGRDRVNCAINAVESLSKTGIIIWDDTEREYYKEGFDYLKSKEFKCITFAGIKGMEDRPSYSSIFYRKDNCLNI